MKVIIPIVGNDTLENNTDYMLSLYEIERKTIFQYCYDFLKPIENAAVIVFVYSVLCCLWVLLCKITKLKKAPFSFKCIPFACH